MPTGNAPVTSDPMFGSRTTLPYETAGNPTTGSSAAGPSAERAVREAADGTATARQANVIALLSDAGPLGMTWFEIADVTKEHHGQVSGALSALHKAGRVAALKSERRGRSGVYVLPQHVAGREIRPFNGGISQHEAQIMAKTLERQEGIGTGVHEAIESFDAPAASLTDTERELVDRLRKAAPDWKDKGSMPVRPASVATLVAIIDRLLR